MSDAELSFRKSANIDRVTDKRKDSLFRLVDTDGSGTIDAQEFAVLYDAIKKDLAEELEKEAALEKEASSARRRFKMLLLFVAVLVSFLAASVAANFAVIFTVVDEAITTTTTGSGFLEVKGSDIVAKTAIATQDVPLIAAPALDIDALSKVNSLRVTYATSHGSTQSHLNIVGVRKHNATFVEFITDIAGQTVETLNGVSSFVVSSTDRDALVMKKYSVCSANATCSAFRASGVDVEAAIDSARSALSANGFEDAARRLQLDPYLDSSACSTTGSWTGGRCTHYGNANGPMCAGSGLIEYGGVFYFSGYHARRHVVFILHGAGENFQSTWNIYCTAHPSTNCPAFEVDEFKHLVFVFPQSGVYAGLTRAWNNYLTQPSAYYNGANVLRRMMCTTASWSSCTPGGALGTTSGAGFGTTTDPVYMNVDGDSEVMIIGFSNGGGMAMYGNWMHGATISKAVAIDYHGQHNTDWLVTASSQPPAPPMPADAGNYLAAKVYVACESMWYSTDLITTPGAGGYTLVGEASLVADPNPSWVTYGPLPYYTPSYPAAGFREWNWYHPVDGRYLTFTVHGLDQYDFATTASCTSTAIPTPGDGGAVHGSMKKYVDLQADILDWVTAPPPPSPPAPSPPPSPPVNTGGGSGKGVGGVVFNFPMCDMVRDCCPTGFSCITPRGWFRAGSTQKACVGPGDFLAHPVPCKIMTKGPTICLMPAEEAEKLIEWMNEQDPRKFKPKDPCELLYWPFTKAGMKSQSRGNFLAGKECDITHICKLQRENYKEADKLSWSCHNKPVYKLC